MIRRMSLMNPMSSMRSASSRTRISTLPQVRDLLLDEVEEPAGRRDEDLGAAADAVDLRGIADAAVDHDRADRAGLAVDADALLDLERELASRHDDERPHRQPLDALRTRADRVPRRRAVLLEELEDRQHECRGLAGAGLGAGAEVAPGEDERNGLRLDRGGFDIALVGDGTEQLGIEPEFGEGHAQILLTGPPAGAGPGQGA